MPSTKKVRSPPLPQGETLVAAEPPKVAGPQETYPEIYHQIERKLFERSRQADARMAEPSKAP